MKILLAPWGDPTRWKPIYYSMGSHKERSISTLSILSKCYDKVFILVLDSLIDISPDENSNLYNEYKCTIYEANKRENLRYNDMVDAISSFVKKVVGTLSNSVEVGEKFEIIVLPSFGSLGGVTTFKGKPEDYISIGLIKISKKLQSFDNITDISVDLTNGLNFIAGLTIKMAEQLSDLTLMKNTTENGISVEYYNSDPYSPSNKEKEHIIRTVLKDRKNKIIFPYLSLKEDSKGLMNKNDDSNSNDEYKKINKYYNNYVPNVIKSLYYPFPLILKYYAGKEMEMCDKILNLWEDGICISGNEINRHLNINQKKLFALMFANIVLKKMTADYSIDCIDQEAKNIYPKISEIGSILINKEINHIKNALAALRTNSVNSENYGKLFFSGPNQLVNKKSLPDKRILIAHAGFQNDFVEIFKNGDVKYTEEIETILNAVG